MSLYQELGKQLFDALNSGQSIGPLRALIDNDIDAAYAIQKELVTLRKARGEKVVGKKIGLTSFAVQKQLGVDQPDYGILFDTMDVSRSKSIDSSKLILPKVEGELAFILGKDITSKNITMDILVDAIAEVRASIEVVDSRVEDWNIQISDTIADNASGSHFILGEDNKLLNNLNPETISMKLYKNGKLSSEGNGRACMDNPLNAALWLAQKMNNQGEPLCKGEVLLSGALGPMVSVIKGDDIRMDMDGFASIHLTID
jgi:2-keto-4-pentenoate hydratase